MLAKRELHLIIHKLLVLLFPTLPSLQNVRHGSVNLYKPLMPSHPLLDELQVLVWALFLLSAILSQTPLLAILSQTPLLET